MDLKGAKIRNIHRLCAKIEEELKKPLSINVPFYQRPFSWGEEEINKLISDYYQYIENVKSDRQTKSYFAGSIVTVIKDGNEYHDLIDGQQRITTLFLTNYIIFLLLRVYISQLIMHRKTPWLDSALQNLVEVVSNLFKNKKNSELHNIREHIMNQIADIEGEEDEEDTEREEKYNKVLTNFHNITYLPDPEIMLDNDSYNTNYIAKQNDLFSKFELSLRYSRDAFNENLKKVLKNIKIHLTNTSGPYLHITDETINHDKQLSQYKCAIDVIYSNFYYYGFTNKKGNIKSLSKTELIVENMNKFIDNIEFCIIQTGSINDAYTLFEVLNDRSLALNDLDLIKNLFYKHFCQNTTEDEYQVNSYIEELEELWNGRAFKLNDPDYYKKLVSFFSTIFLTGNSEINYNEREKYRNTIEKYLKENYNLSKNKEYTYNKIYSEFSIMFLVRVLLEKANIQHNKRAQNALDAENNFSSIIYRALHLLNGMKQYKIMSAIINLILITFFSENNSIKAKSFDNFLHEVFSHESPSNSNRNYLYKASSQLWRLTLLAENYKIPLQFSKQIIFSNYYNSSINEAELSADMLDEAKKQYKEWTNTWQKNINDDFKVKILFLNLLKVNKVNNKLVRCNAEKRFNNPENIQLDHIEPQQIDSNHLSFYFMPTNPEERSRHINQIGNLILMDAYHNNRKSNSPAYNIFNYLDKSGLGENSWWVTTELKEYLNYYSDQNNVPTENFFLERKSLLRKYFYTLLSYEYNFFEFPLVNLN